MPKACGPKDNRRHLWPKARGPKDSRRHSWSEARGPKDRRQTWPVCGGGVAPTPVYETCFLQMRVREATA